MFAPLRKTFIATITLVLLQACSDPQAGTANIETTNESTTFEKAMNNYSDRLVEKTNLSISNPTSPKKTTDMPSYVVKYTINNDALITKEDGDKNITSYAINTGITTAWSQAFCTDDLKMIMSKYGVKMVTGQLVSRDGEKHSMSACMN